MLRHISYLGRDTEWWHVGELSYILQCMIIMCVRGEERGGLDCGTEILLLVHRRTSNTALYDY